MKLFLKSAFFISLALPAFIFAEDDFPEFAEPMKYQEDIFLVSEGFPSQILDPKLYKSENEKDTRILPSGAAIAVGTFSSFGERFYRVPLKISQKDSRRIQKLLAEAVQISNAESPLSHEDYLQADYKIVYCHDGHGYNIHIYPDLRAINLFKNDGAGGTLQLDANLFEELVSILRRYQHEKS